MNDQNAPALALPDGWRLADHKKYGRVVVTHPTPDADGYIYFVRSDDEFVAGFDWAACLPDELTYIDTGQEADTSDAVPPNALAVGSVWDDSGALRRACMESGDTRIVVIDTDFEPRVWDAEAGRWRDGGPIPQFAPYTIIHIDQEADQ